MATAINPLEIRFILILSPATVAIGSFVVCCITLLRGPATAGPPGFFVFFDWEYVAGAETGFGILSKIFGGQE